MMRSVLVLWVLFLIALSPSVVHADAGEPYPALPRTWQQAYANCQYSISNNSLWNTNTTGGRQCFPNTSIKIWQVHTNDAYGNPGVWSCRNADCDYSGNNPPVCTQGQSSWPTNSWKDGVDCAGGCYVIPTLQVGQPVTYSENGDYCPYDPNSPPDPNNPPVNPPQQNNPPPQTCNPDGSCTYCTADVCVTTHPGPPTPPAPPSTTGQGGCAAATCSTTGGGGTPGSGGSTAPPSGSSGGAPASGSSTSTKCTTGVCDVGNADGNVGGLYQGSADTPQSMFSNYMAQVQSAPIVTATTGFFTVSASSSCPSWHIPGNDYWGKAGFDFTFFCQPGMLTLFQIAGWMVLAGGAFCAFRIAIY